MSVLPVAVKLCQCSLLLLSKADFSMYLAETHVKYMQQPFLIDHHVR